MAEIRTDGCYVMLDRDGYWSYLKFFADGLVLSVTADQPPTRFAQHLSPGNPVFSYGRVAEVDGAVRVTTTNDEGGVTFVVLPVNDKVLAVHSTSNINGAEFDDVYTYVPS